jgi:hypothetical protein
MASPKKCHTDPLQYFDDLRELPCPGVDCGRSCQCGVGDGSAAGHRAARVRPDLHQHFGARLEYHPDFWRQRAGAATISDRGVRYRTPSALTAFPRREDQHRGFMLLSLGKSYNFAPRVLKP